MQPGPEGEPGSTHWPDNAARPSGAEETWGPGGEAAVLGTGVSEQETNLTHETNLTQETTLTHQQALAAYFSFFGSAAEGECKDEVEPR